MHGYVVNKFSKFRLYDQMVTWPFVGGGPWAVNTGCPSEKHAIKHSENRGTIQRLPLDEDLSRCNI